MEKKTERQHAHEKKDEKTSRKKTQAGLQLMNKKRKYDSMRQAEKMKTCL